MTTVIDSDQHLYEPRNLWREHCDPRDRDEAIRIEDDDLGYAWVMWRDQRLGLADVQAPHETEAIGARRHRRESGEPAEYSYDEALPDAFWDPAARAEQLRTMGLDAAMCFPNFGLGWERKLSGSLPALLANMTAWNRWCAIVAHEGDGAIHPVAHVTMRDLAWLDGQLDALAAAGVRTAMMAPALVDGKPLSHPDLDRAWSSFVAHGIAPVFHVADQPRVFDDAWYTDDGSAFVNIMESVFLWTPAAVAATDLIVNGVLERHRDLRLGIVELSAIWVPQFLMMLDGGYDFTSKLNGRVPASLSMRPSEYFRRHVRVSAFAYEQPAHIERKAGDLLMACSDYPHSEGTDTPLEDYARVGSEPGGPSGLFAANAAFLLGLDAA